MELSFYQHDGKCWKFVVLVLAYKTVHRPENKWRGFATIPTNTKPPDGQILTVPIKVLINWQDNFTFNTNKLQQPLVIINGQ